MKSIVAIVFAVVLAILLVATIISASDAFFHGTAIGMSIMVTMLEWTVKNWRLLVPLDLMMMAYGWYRVIGIIKYNRSQRHNYGTPYYVPMKWSWQYESGYLSFTLSKFLLVWIVFGMKFSHL